MFASVDWCDKEQCVYYIIYPSGFGLIFYIWDIRVYMIGEMFSV